MGHGPLHISRINVFTYSYCLFYTFEQFATGLIDLFHSDIVKMNVIEIKYLKSEQLL